MTFWESVERLMAAGLLRASPLVVAAVGETLAERAGVLNLGVEGLMLLGAMVGVAGAQATGSPEMGLLAGAGAGAALGVLHAVLTVVLRCDQVVAGLSLVFLGTGLSSLWGADLVAVRAGVPQFAVGEWSGAMPVLRVATWLPGVVWLAPVVALAAWIHLYRTKWGLIHRGVGEDAEAMASLGVRVKWWRCLYVVLGGVLGGLGGALVSLAVTPGWSDGMIAGQGFIAVALVIVGSWNPLWVAVGAFGFGILHRLALDLQGSGIPLFQNPSAGFFLSMVPYLAAIVVLTVVSRRGTGAGRAPAGLAK